MKLKVLGCSGGIGQGLRTTSLLVDEDVLIDVGSGVGDLSRDEMLKIRHVFLTHSHLDHIAFLPLLVDSLFDRIDEPIVIHALPETIAALKKHIFNWVIWPDFATLPTANRPVMRYEPLEAGYVCDIAGRQFEAIAVNHIVPAVGYRVESANGRSFAFTGDTTSNDGFWAALNKYASLDLLLSEAAFANKDEALSQLARHYCAKTLAQDIAKLKHRPQIYLTHHKPTEEATILAEVAAAVPGRQIKQLTHNFIFQL